MVAAVENVFLGDGLHVLDCLDGLSRLAPNSVDLVFADLPYGCTANDWDRVIPIDRLWEGLNRVCRPTAPMVFTAIQPFTSLLVCSNMKSFRFSMVWKKNKMRGFLHAKKRPMRAHEDVVVFYRKQAIYVPQMTTGHRPMSKAMKGASASKCYLPVGAAFNNFGTTERYPTTILDIPVVNNDDPEHIHSTQKPEKLVEWFVRTYTKPGDLVLDPTAGSGTTLVTAIKEGRRAIGFESDAVMAAKARARIDRAVQSRRSAA